MSSINPPLDHHALGSPFSPVDGAPGAPVTVPDLSTGSGIPFSATSLTLWTDVEEPTNQDPMTTLITVTPGDNPSNPVVSPNTDTVQGAITVAQNMTSVINNTIANLPPNTPASTLAWLKSVASAIAQLQKALQTEESQSNISTVNQQYQSDLDQIQQNYAQIQQQEQQEQQQQARVAHLSSFMAGFMAFFQCLNFACEKHESPVSAYNQLKNLYEGNLDTSDGSGTGSLKTSTINSAVTANTTSMQQLNTLMNQVSGDGSSTSIATTIEQLMQLIKLLKQVLASVQSGGGGGGG